MALIKCPECGKEVSEKAELCIHCGYPIAQTKSFDSAKTIRISILIICIIVTVVLALCIIGVIHNGSNNDTAKEESQFSSAKPLSFDVTEMYLDDIYDNFVATQKTLVDALMSYGEFTTLDDITSFERIWITAIDSFDEDLDVLAQNISADEYAEYWSSLHTNLQNFRDLCVPFTNLDPNGDGTYTSEEGDNIYNENAPILKDTLVMILEDYKDFCLMKEIYAVTVPETSAPTSKNNYKESSKKCLECEKTASYSYTNPFSGEEELYCYIHYKEIIDMMGDMEADVGDSNQSKHTCEQCNKEGIHVYYSFTGQTEYYCTEHYEELMDMLEAFGVE